MTAAMTIHEAYIEARLNDDLVREFNRLNKSVLRAGARPASSIDDMIDDASGRTDKDERAFCEFFMVFIWFPIILGTVA